MRSTALLFAPFAILVFSVLPAASDDTAPTLPERKAGLWELKTVMDEGNGPRDQTMKLCIDAQMEKTTVSTSVVDHKANCTTYDIKSAAGARSSIPTACIMAARS